MEQAAPKTLRELKFLIAKRHVVLTARQGSLVRVMLDQPDLPAFASMRELGGTCNASASTVDRLAKSLGFQSFHDLRRLFQEHLRERARAGRPAPDPDAIVNRS